MGCSGASASECGVNNPKTFDAIDGTPIKYKFPDGYERIDVKTTTGFYNKLEAWISTLRYFSKTYAGSWFNTLQWIGHAGAYVCKAGCHGQGRAFDVNRVEWNGYAVKMLAKDHADPDRTRRRRYLAVDACCRRHFKYTLDGWYNSDHHNHIHIDNHTVPVLSRQSESDTKFVQAVCNNFNGAGLAVDGDWGPLTENAFDNINREWGYSIANCNPFNDQSHYAEWCNQVMRHGFDDVTAGTYQSVC